MKISKKFAQLRSAAVLSLLAVFASTSHALAQTARIAFSAPASVQTSVRPAKYATYDQIFSMNPDGSDVVQLTSDRAAALAPSWSSGQQYIAFWRNGALWVMQAVGEANGGKSFAVASGVIIGSAWSPNSSATEATLVYQGNPSNLFTVAINPSALTAGTPVLLTTGYWYNPSWSPDGTKIAANGNDDGGIAEPINVFDAATGSVHASFSSPANLNFAPKWSPDGSQIAFIGGPEETLTTTTGKNGKTTTTVTITGYADIYLANADGTGITQVTDWNSSIGFPTWSPDGTTLAFRANDGIYTTVIGSGVVSLLYAGGNTPDWNP